MNGFSGFQPTPFQTTDIEKAADRLADKLAETPEVRELVRLALALRDDPDVRRIAQGIRDLKAAEGEHKQPMMDSLLQQRESLPVVMAYRRAEHNVSQLFSEVDRHISQAAGMDFAAHARANLDLLQR